MKLFHARCGYPVAETAQRLVCLHCHEEVPAYAVERWVRQP